MQGGEVDLRLAVNYYPVVLSVFKSFVSWSVFVMCEPLGIDFASCLLLTIVILDRVLFNEHLIDSNACMATCCLFLILSRTRPDYEFSHLITVIHNMVWTLMCVGLVYDSGLFNKRKKIVLVVSALLFFCYSRLPVEHESVYLSLARIMLFNMTAFAWIYVASVNYIHNNCVESFTPCVVRFAPILFTSYLLFFAFVLVICVIVFLKTYNIAKLTVYPDSDEEKTDSTDVEVHIEEDEEVLAQFKAIRARHVV